MKPIKLISDSTCDLTRDILKERQIEAIPMHVSFGEEHYLDGVNLSVEEMYQKVENKGELPKSAAISPGEFEVVFSKYLDQGYQILYIGIGARLSGTFQSANLAKNLLESDDIHIIDSANLSSGTGLLLLKASDMIQANKDIETIKYMIQELIPKIRSQFVIDTLDYLYKGGRLNVLSNFMGNMLRLHPLIKVVDGQMIVGKKISGAMRKAIRYMINETVMNQDNIDSAYMMITHSKADNNAIYIRKELEDKMNIDTIYETEAGCTISTHCGAGTIGILYIEK
ncbi:MAG: DegV family protein [Candidatus Izimaplasma sp.]|nr:DegV family protein [Candidatus Izimaplasma bacterium]